MDVSDKILIQVIVKTVHKQKMYSFGNVRFTFL